MIAPDVFFGLLNSLLLSLQVMFSALFLGGELLPLRKDFLGFLQAFDTAASSQKFRLGLPG